MIFNRINCHGHLRLSGVCKRWFNLVQNDVPFMRTVKFNASRLNDSQPLMRSYKFVNFDNYRWENSIAQNLQDLLNNVETIDFGYTTDVPLFRILPMCENLKEMCNIHTSHTFYKPTEHPRPVKISSIIPNEGFLDHFKVITNCSQLHLIGKPTKGLIAKYGALINSLTICLASTGSVEYWSQYDKLHLQLQYLCIRDTSDARVATDWIQSFFEKQAPFLKTIEIFFLHNEKTLFDSLCKLLNLETVILTYVTQENLLSDLKVLPKLKRLELNLAETERGDYYHLDIVELTTLTEVCITSNTIGEMSETGPKLNIMSQNRQMEAMEKMKISLFDLDDRNLETIASVMPNLKELILVIITDIFEYLTPT
jgi:hypothetical protein